MAQIPPPPTTHSDPAADRAARLERLAQRTRTTSAPTGDADTAAAPRRRRNHPARGARLGALGLSLVTTAGLAGLFATSGGSSSAESAASVVARPVSSSTTRTASTPIVVDGAVFRNKWGPVQVEATFAPDGTLAEVVALQTPNDRRQSVSINDHAVPRLTTEALTAQTAEVHTVSGATYTSEGYRQSLQSAIDAARAAGVPVIA